MKVSVRKRHIDEGMPRTCSRCPVALAIAETLDVLHPDVSVAQSKILVFDGKCRVDMETPDRVRRFIEDFDQHRPVRGFTFELDVQEN